MPDDLTRFRAGVTRVVCPGGIRGTVERVSDTPGRKWPILVRRDDGQSRSYAPTELTVLAVEAPQGKGAPYP